MAIYINLVPGTPRPIEGLCPSCHNPSMVELEVHMLSTADAGIGTAGVQRLCVDCDLESDGRSGQ